MPVTGSPQVVWFKKDLRVSDHRPLAEASARGPVICLFILEDEWLESSHFEKRHLRFALDCLIELDCDLRKLGGSLTILRGNCLAALNYLRTQMPFTHLWSHQETGDRQTYERDLQVRDWCNEQGVQWKEFRQNGVIRKLKSRDGWNSRWEEFMARQPAPIPSKLHSAPSIAGITFKELADLAGDRHTHIQRGGSTHANNILDSFLTQRGQNYSKDLSSPVRAFDGCSRLSPHISFGTVSMREVVQATRSRVRTLRQHDPTGKESSEIRQWLRSLKSFDGRLHWHCHFIQKLEDEPSMEFENLSRVFDGMREPHWNQEYFEKWCAGLTGYPMIDACMRCLRQTGWLNFRMRAMVMSFASYHLWLHWREPALHLARMFTDFEPGIHFSQAQMQSGTTGINTIRIYSPTKQGHDQDPDGLFIRRWVPELADLPSPLIHEPHKITPLDRAQFPGLSRHDYPRPLVDHKSAWLQARRKLAQFRNTPEARQAADAIQKKHGSRKSGIRQMRALNQKPPSRHHSKDDGQLLLPFQESQSPGTNI